MRTLHGLDHLPLAVPGSVVTLGVFDGVHLGHQAVIERTRTWSRELGVPAVGVTFRNHPGLVLGPEGPPLIMSLEHRLLLLDRHGLDVCLVLDFTRELSEMPAETFTRLVFVQGLAARVIVLGFDAHFGRGRQGDAKFLESEGVRYGFRVESIGPVEAGGLRVSSTAVREGLARNDLEAVRAMLGRPYSILGLVVRGEGRGRALGYPTANLELQQELIPPGGVYVARARVAASWLQALVSIGDKPTFRSASRAVQPAVEVHLVDYCGGELYGTRMEVEFLARLRAQEKFTDPRDLAARIGDDVDRARRYFAGDLEG